MKNNSEVILAGEKYISSRRASEITGYATDYIGQLCRAGKIKCQRIGRDWVVSETDILNYKKVPKIVVRNYIPSDIWDQALLGKPSLVQKDKLKLSDYKFSLKGAKPYFAILGIALAIFSSAIFYQPAENLLALSIRLPELPELPNFQSLIPNFSLPQFPFTVSDIAFSISDIKKITSDFFPSGEPKIITFEQPLSTSPPTPPLLAKERGMGGEVILSNLTSLIDSKINSRFRELNDRLISNLQLLTSNIEKRLPPSVQNPITYIATLRLPGLPNLQSLIPNFSLPQFPFTVSDIAFSISDIKLRFSQNLLAWRDYVFSLGDFAFLWFGDIKKITSDFFYSPPPSPIPQLSPKEPKIITFETKPSSEPRSEREGVGAPRVFEGGLRPSETNEASLNTALLSNLTSLIDFKINSKFKALNSEILDKITASLTSIEKRLPPSVQNPITYITTQVPGPYSYSPPQIGSGVSASFGDFSSGISTGGNLTASGNVTLGKESSDVAVLSQNWRINSAGVSTGFSSLATVTLTR